MLVKFLNKKAKIISLAILTVSLSLFIIGISQKGICKEEKAKDSNSTPILEILLGGISGAIFGAIAGGVVNSILSKRRDKQRSRSLITAFLAESIYNFSRCILYYAQKTVGRVSKSSLFETTDAGALASLANVIDNPRLISAIVELKSTYYQIGRYTENIAPQIAKRNQLETRIAMIKQTAPRDSLSEEVSRLAAEIMSLDKAISDAQGSVLAFFDYEEAINNIRVIIDETKKLIPKSGLITEMEMEFQNNSSAKEYIDKEKKNMPDPGSTEWQKWSENLLKKFVSIRTEGQ